MEDLTKLVYDAVLNNAQWQAFLDVLLSAVHAQRGSFTVRDERGEEFRSTAGPVEFSPDEIAREFRNSIETIRTHMVRIMAKSHDHKKRESVLLVLRSVPHRQDF